MNLIKINGITYKLPNKPETLNVVLNHLDMVKKGIKDFAKLRDLNDVEHKISTLALSTGKIHISVE